MQLNIAPEVTQAVTAAASLSVSRESASRMMKRSTDMSSATRKRHIIGGIVSSHGSTKTMSVPRARSLSRTVCRGENKGLHFKAHLGQLKDQIYTTVVKPAMIFGYKCWTVKKHRRKNYTPPRWECGDWLEAIQRRATSRRKTSGETPTSNQSSERDDVDGMTTC